MPHFFAVDGFQRLHRLCGPGLAEQLNHPRCYIQPTRFQHHGHHSQASHEIIGGVFSGAPHTSMGGQSAIMAAHLFKAVADQIEMFTFFLRGFDPVVVETRRQRHIGKARDDVPVQVHGVQFDMRHCVQQRDASCRAARFAFRHVARVHQLRCFRTGRVHGRVGSANLDRVSLAGAGGKPGVGVLVRQGGFRAPVRRGQHLDRHFCKGKCHGAGLFPAPGSASPNCVSRPRPADHAAGRIAQHCGYSALTASSTSSTWPGTLTLSHRRKIVPSAPMSTVVRSMPMKVLPYIFFSFHTP